MTREYIYEYEDIFEEDPNNPENVLMNIPLEIRESMKLNSGDSVTVRVEDDKIFLRKNG